MECLVAIVTQNLNRLALNNKCYIHLKFFCSPRESWCMISCLTVSVEWEQELYFIHVFFCENIKRQRACFLYIACMLCKRNINERNLQIYWSYKMLLIKSHVRLIESFTAGFHQRCRLLRFPEKQRLLLLSVKIKVPKAFPIFKEK